MKEKIMLLLVLLCISGYQSALAASSWVINPSAVADGNFPFQYNIDIGGAPFPGKIECGQSNCVFGPFLRTGTGKSGELCDSGGWCTSVMGKDPDKFRMIKINNGTSWQEAFEQYIKRYGASGGYSVADIIDVSDKGIRWDALCSGFAVTGVSGGISRMAPNSACAQSPRPGLSCTLQLDNSNIYLGTWLTRQQTTLTARAHGVIKCNRLADIKMTLLNEVRLDDRMPVTLKANDKSLSGVAALIGRADTQLDVNIDIQANGIFDHAGTRTANAILSVGYY